MSFLYANLTSISLDNKNDVLDRKLHTIIGAKHLNENDPSKSIFKIKSSNAVGNLQTMRRTLNSCSSFNIYEFIVDYFAITFVIHHQSIFNMLDLWCARRDSNPEPSDP